MVASSLSHPVWSEDMIRIYQAPKTKGIGSGRLSILKNLALEQHRGIVNQIKRFLSQSFDEGSNEDIEKIDQMDGLTACVVNQGGHREQIIAVAILHLHPEVTSSIAVLTWMLVRSNLRRKGLGAFLFEVVCELARKKLGKKDQSILLAIDKYAKEVKDYWVQKGFRPLPSWETDQTVLQLAKSNNYYFPGYQCHVDPFLKQI